MEMCNILNPASLWLLELMTEYTCEQVIIQTYAHRPDLTDKPFLKPKDEWYTEGSSFMLNRERKAGYAVLSQEGVTETQPLLAETSAQKQNW
jgi:hypothetical protein